MSYYENANGFKYLFTLLKGNIISLSAHLKKYRKLFMLQNDKP